MTAPEEPEAPAATAGSQQRPTATDRTNGAYPDPTPAMLPMSVVAATALARRNLQLFLRPPSIRKSGSGSGDSASSPIMAAISAARGGRAK